MKRLTTYLNERLVVNKNYKQVYTCAPASFDELREIIKQRYKEQGPGTEQKPINFNDIDVSNIDSFYNEDIGIFARTKFEYIDISNWNVSNAENICAMFWQCTNLKSVGDLSGWDVSNVKDMSYMFYNCKKLKSIGDLSNWDVSNVEDMYFMFNNCHKLKLVGDLSNWDASNIEDMNGMFYNSGIKNIPSWHW